MLFNVVVEESQSDVIRGTEQIIRVGALSLAAKPRGSPLSLLQRCPFIRHSLPK